MVEGKVCWQIIKEDARSHLWQRSLPVVIRGGGTSDWSRLISRRSGRQVTAACSSCREIKVCCSNNRVRRYRYLGTVLGLQEFYSVLHVHQMEFPDKSKELIWSIVERIGASTCKSFPGIPCVHWLWYSAFQGWGKVLLFQIMAEDQGFQEVFRGLGREWQLSNELYRDLQRFTCAMYRKNAGTNEVNELRYRFFCWRKGTVDFN